MFIFKEANESIWGTSVFIMHITHRLSVRILFNINTHTHKLPLSGSCMLVRLCSGFVLKLHFSIINRSTVWWSGICDFFFFFVKHLLLYICLLCLKKMLILTQKKILALIISCYSTIRRGVLMEWGARLAQHRQHCTQLRRQIIHSKRLNQCVFPMSLIFF